MRGKAFRRDMQNKKDRRLRETIVQCRCKPSAGSITHAWIDGIWQPVGDYIKYPKNSNIQKYLKRQTKRKVRRSEPFPNGNSYRKCIEYQWQFW